MEDIEKTENNNSNNEYKIFEDIKHIDHKLTRYACYLIAMNGA